MRTDPGGNQRPRIHHKHHRPHQQLTTPCLRGEIEFIGDDICAAPVGDNHGHVHGHACQIQHPLHPVSSLLLHILDLLLVYVVGVVAEFDHHLLLDVLIVGVDWGGCAVDGPAG